MKDDWKIRRGGNWPNSNNWVMFPSPQDQGSTMCLRLYQWQFWIIQIPSVKGCTVVIGKRTQCFVKIIAEDLRFSKKDDVRLVKVNIVLEVEEIPGYAFNIPS